MLFNSEQLLGKFFIKTINTEQTTKQTKTKLNKNKKLVGRGRRYHRHAAINEMIHRAGADGKRPDGMSLTPWSAGLVWDATCPDNHSIGTSVELRKVVFSLM